MICIFCQNPSANSKSKEHIIPESLGNKTHILSKGVVCDKCNNYFSVKIEKELLNQPYFLSLRNRNDIKTKKNRAVPQKVFMPGLGSVNIWLEYTDTGISLCTEENINIINLISEDKIKHLIIPCLPEPILNNYHLSRFLAKTALEYLAYFFSEENFIKETLQEDQFNAIRKYARYGDGTKIWPYSQRRIYNEGDFFINEKEKGLPYEILHEMDLLMIDIPFEGTSNLTTSVA